MIKCLPPGNKKFFLAMVDMIYPKLLIAMERKKKIDLKTLNASLVSIDCQTKIENLEFCLLNFDPIGY